MEQEHANASRPLQILSLDGGGIKGLFSAAVLAAIEKNLKTEITSHFDLIAGTSTGGIIALGLGLGMRPSEIVDFYLKEGPKIFPSWRGLKSLQHWFYRKYSNEPLELALKSCFSEKKFGDSNKRLVIPSYSLTDNDIYLFRTPHHHRLENDWNVPAWKVGMATGAAPSYFPCFRGIDKIRLVDGGVWANNPALVAIVEAVNCLSASLSTIKVLSIGTSDVVQGRRRRLNSGGKLAYAFGNAAVEIILRGQSIAVEKQSRLLVGKENFERLNPAAADGDYSLDGIDDADELIGKASHLTRHRFSVLKAMFLTHRADDYRALYR